MQLEDLKPGIRVTGVVPHESVTVIYAQAHGSDTIELTYKTAAGGLGQQVLFRNDEDRLELSTTGARPFDAPASDFKIVAEAQRIKMAGLYDPMLAVSTSDIQPLPHQIRAVYGELLPRAPLRFLLADDPGAGKTIMAGLYIKELILRDDVERCLVVVPGGLVEQWQDELFYKFGLSFEILTSQMIDASIHNPFENHPLLIARMDQLSRSDELLRLLGESEWDLGIVDEAHRMAAHHFPNKVDKTKRFVLGELLGGIVRHFLLLTATPHSGKEENFQLFLSLLDKDRFAGRRTTPVDTRDVMRRMVKEDLRTFDGRRLFPERIAESVPYVISEAESHLYDEVTEYVRTGMNRAADLDGRRRNTVGFALTVLQRRLASSPEAIYRSLVRRADRLEKLQLDIEDEGRRAGQVGAVLDDPDLLEVDAAELEEMEDGLVDSATAAQSAAELEGEVLELRRLAEVAKRVRDSGRDKKWSELSQILQDNVISRDDAGNPRKLIIFTEHRDTLSYLSERIGALTQRLDSVLSIHGGVRRSERRRITEEFSKNPQCQILLATDAAGEGLNLQAAHLMVNYDLPWNPNRLEQRFGRIHRIGQTEVCRLWNLVASNTREGQVFVTLLDKLEQQRLAYGDRVFDILGTVFAETPLRDLLIEAIRYGEQPAVRQRMFEVIERNVADGLRELIESAALASEHLSDADLATLNGEMSDAETRRLMPRDIESAFREAFTRFNGRMVRREGGRYEIHSVPAALRTSRYIAVASRYEHVAFELAAARPKGDLPPADLLAPGHPLHDAVMDQAITTFAGVLNRGTVLASKAISEAQLLIGVLEEIVDATGVSVARRFSYAYVGPDGSVGDAGPAPYLDCVEPPAERADSLASAPWLLDAESRAVSWIIENELPAYLAEVAPRRTAELTKQRGLVEQRLLEERDRLLREADAATAREQFGEKPRETAESLIRKASELETRLQSRLQLIDRQLQMSTKPPVVAAAAIVIPAI